MLSGSASTVSGTIEGDPHASGRSSHAGIDEVRCNTPITTLSVGDSGSGVLGSGMASAGNSGVGRALGARGRRAPMGTDAGAPMALAGALGRCG